jgi:hypothetical protein
VVSKKWVVVFVFKTQLETTSVKRGEISESVGGCCFCVGWFCVLSVDGVFL